MARRDRTTGLPRARARQADAAPSRRIPWTERHTRFALIGGAVALLLVVIGAFAWRIYDENINLPNKEVLRVGDDTASLEYYAARLGPFVRENATSGSTLELLQENLISKIEQEMLTVQLAEQAGIDLSDTAVTAFIADELGVAPDTENYDTLYRQQLRTLGISGSTYRRLKEAELADTRLRERITPEVGDSGEMVTLRIVLVNSQAEAQSVYDRVEGGEDLGTIAQNESLELDSRQNDGLLSAQPEELFDTSVREAIGGQPAGTLIGPLSVQGSWWVVRVEERAEGDYTDTQKVSLTDVRFDEQVRAERARLVAEGQVRRNITASDFEWAVDHAN